MPFATVTTFLILYLHSDSMQIMIRQAWIVLSGAAHHVTLRGNNRKDIFFKKWLLSPLFHNGSVDKIEEMLTLLKYRLDPYEKRKSVWINSET